MGRSLTRTGSPSGRTLMNGDTRDPPSRRLPPDGDRATTFPSPPRSTPLCPLPYTAEGPVCSVVDCIVLEQDDFKRRATVNPLKDGVPASGKNLNPLRRADRDVAGLEHRAHGPCRALTDSYLHASTNAGLSSTSD